MEINFVDEMPIEAHVHLNKNQVLTGKIFYRPTRIYILRGEKQYLILLHELVHWFFDCIIKSRKPHRFLDNHFTVP